LVRFECVLNRNVLFVQGNHGLTGFGHGIATA
jgi:hypothetical protein